MYKIILCVISSDFVFFWKCPYKRAKHNWPKMINKMILNYICYNHRLVPCLAILREASSGCRDPYIRGLHQVVPLGALGTSQRMGKNTIGIWGIEDTRGTQSTESHKQGSYSLTETEAESNGPTGSAPGPLGICYGCYLCVLWTFMFLWEHACFWLFGLFNLSKLDRQGFALSNCILFS